MDDILFPEASEVLQEAAVRHADVLAFAVEAIDMAHIAFNRERDFSATFIPGVPNTRRVRNDINDNAWRMFQAIADPLIGDAKIRAFKEADGGDIVILTDGLTVRLKKGDKRGRTSNYPTPTIIRKSITSERLIFSGATPLDLAIHSGVGIDVVYIAGEAMGDYEAVGLRFAATEASPFLTLPPPTVETLQTISPTAFNLAADLRAKLG